MGILALDRQSVTVGDPTLGRYRTKQLILGVAEKLNLTQGKGIEQFTCRI